MNALSKLLALALMLAGLCAHARAALPPSAYLKFQKEAPEVLQIRVLAVGERCGIGVGAVCRFTVRAKVICAAHSQSGLKAGAAIAISYSSIFERPRGWAGGAPIPRLSSNRDYPAFLRKSGTGYVPAAQAMSFALIRDKGDAPPQPPCTP